MGVVMEPIRLKEEAPLFFTQEGEAKEFGCIGHLTGDFGRDGHAFATVWTPHSCHDRNDELFQSVFDAVINCLRARGGVLCSRADMEAYCRGKSANRLCHTPQGHVSVGFRILTQDYAIYLRCEPRNDSDHFFVYCYDKEILMSKLAKDRGLPRYCYAYLPTTKEEIRIDFAENGYTPYRKQGNGRAAKEMNRELGITPAQAEAMVSGSMFGWDCPAADPKNYEENGKPRRVKNENREERE